MGLLIHVAIDLELTAGNRGVPQFVFFIVLETEETNDLVTITLLFVFEEIDDRDVVRIETDHSLGPTVRNGFGAFDGVEKVFTESFFLDLLGGR